MYREWGWWRVAGRRGSVGTSKILRTGAEGGSNIRQFISRLVEQLPITEPSQQIVSRV